MAPFRPQHSALLASVRPAAVGVVAGLLVLTCAACSSGPTGTTPSTATSRSPSPTASTPAGSPPTATTTPAVRTQTLPPTKVYTSVAALTADARRVVIAVPAGAGVPVTLRGRSYLRTPMTVVETLRGSQARLSLLQPGGPGVVTTPPVHLVTSGEKYLLWLRPSTLSPGDDEVVGTTAGLWVIDGSNARHPADGRSRLPAVVAVKDLFAAATDE